MDLGYRTRRVIAVLLTVGVFGSVMLLMAFLLKLAR
jgi:hypothetical protein